MQLTKPELAAYIRFTAANATEEERSRRLERLRDSIHDGRRELADTRVAKDEQGELVAAWRIVSRGEGALLIVGPLPSGNRPDDHAAELLSEVMARACELGALSIMCRLDPGHLRCRAALLTCGFVDMGERIEFKSPLAELPSDAGTPLSWRSMDEVGRTEAVAMLQRAATGDPHGSEEGEDAGVALAGFLSTPDLTHGPSCVQIGYEGDQAVAFLCAQVAPSDGWSRITYMGIVLEARGRGLGTWLHRKGFELLREQGGKLYHGGTAAENKGMLRLFQMHGCKESSRMLELEWHAPAVPG